MLLRCTNAFGNFKPGDEVEVPDGAVFDTAFFELAEAPAQPEQELDAEEGK
jgi:hypothetical protein